MRLQQWTSFIFLFSSLPFIPAAASLRCPVKSWHRQQQPVLAPRQGWRGQVHRHFDVIFRSRDYLPRANMLFPGCSYCIKAKQTEVGRTTALSPVPALEQKGELGRCLMDILLMGNSSRGNTGGGRWWCRSFRSLSINIFRIFHYDQEGKTFPEFNANFNSSPRKAVLSSRAPGFAMCERSPGAAGTLLNKHW